VLIKKRTNYLVNVNQGKASDQGDQSGRLLASWVVVYSGQLRLCKVQKWTNLWGHFLPTLKAKY
jgi:hypothetical protein